MRKPTTLAQRQAHRNMVRAIFWSGYLVFTAIIAGWAYLNI